MAGIFSNVARLTTACCRPDIQVDPSIPVDANLDAVIDGLDQVLFGAKVAFSGLNTRVAEQQLDLLQIPARLPAQFRTRSPQIVRRQRRVPDGRPALPNERID